MESPWWEKTNDFVFSSSGLAIHFKLSINQGSKRSCRSCLIQFSEPSVPLAREASGWWILSLKIPSICAFYMFQCAPFIKAKILFPHCQERHFHLTVWKCYEKNSLPFLVLFLQSFHHWAFILAHRLSHLSLSGGWCYGWTIHMASGNRELAFLLAGYWSGCTHGHCSFALWNHW